MGSFNDRSGGGGSKPYRKPFGARGGFGGGGGGGNRGGFGSPRRDEGEREMHTATCAQCKNECQVPFRPNGTKPIFCNNCFQRDERPRFDGPQERRFDAPQERRFEKPQYEKSAPAAAPNLNEIKIQLDVIHNKLERILKMVSPSNAVEPVVEAPAPRAAKAPKAAAPAVEEVVAMEEAVEPKPKASKKKAAK